MHIISGLCDRICDHAHVSDRKEWQVLAGNSKNHWFAGEWISLADSQPTVSTEVSNIARRTPLIRLEKNEANGQSHQKGWLAFNALKPTNNNLHEQVITMRTGDISRKRRLQGDFRSHFYADYRTARMDPFALNSVRDMVVANAIAKFRRQYSERKAAIAARERQAQIKNAKSLLLSRLWNKFHDALSVLGADQVLLTSDGSMFQRRCIAPSGKQTLRQIRKGRRWKFDGLVVPLTQLGGTRSRCGVIVSENVALKLCSMADYVWGESL